MCAECNASAPLLAPNAAARAQIVPVPKAAKEETDAFGSESEIPPRAAPAQTGLGGTAGSGVPV